MASSASVNQRGDPRILVIGLLLTTWAHGIAEGPVVIMLLGITVITVAIFWNSFCRYWKVVVFTAVILTMLSGVAWITTTSVPLWVLIFELFRWLSMATFSLTVFSSMDALQLIVALRWLHLPRRIAIAVGVSLRFLPVVINQSSRVFSIQRLRMASRRQSTRWQRFVMPVTTFPNLFVSMLRQVENITISIILQDVEKRVDSYKFRELSGLDWMLCGILCVIPGILTLLAIQHG